MADPSAELQSSLRDLSLDQKSPVQDIRRPTVQTTMASGSSASTSKPKKAASKPVADSWEDEASGSSDDERTPREKETSASILSPTLSAEGPLDPPPTPTSPQTSNPWASIGSTAPVAGQSSAATERRRPEKQTAVANRLIAGALGIRAPKRTEGQRAYDRSVKEQEIKRRNREREQAAQAKEEEEQLKAAVWTD